MNQVNPTQPPSSAHLPLDGHNVVVTRALSGFTRHTINDEIIRRGGTPQRAVTGTTTLLLVGEKAGSKLAKARQRNITVIDQATFENQYS